MKNKVVLEYLSILFNEKTIRKSEEALYKNILESEVSIKDFYIVLKREGVDRQDILSLAYDIFLIMKNDSDREEALKLVGDTVKNYKSYFGFENYRMFISKVYSAVSSSLCSSPEQLKKIKVLPKVGMIEIDGVVYEVDYRKHLDNFNYMELHALSGTEQINNIIAILFKDKKHEILKAHNRRKYEAILERLRIEEYDFLLLA